MKTFPIRLIPGQDLREALEAAVRAQGCQAAFVLSGVGSLVDARIRFAGADEPLCICGDSEILSLSGTLGVGAAGDAGRGHSHLHIAVAAATGEVFGGHLAPGCRVRTTAEVLLALLPEWTFMREADAATGFAELVVKAREG
ncbi:MAG: DNA-binding protein [Gammaproteobacteria bacterium]|uniref:PPC domain-containing DNA-binding protein n=1 Tax=Hydrogenophaga sp. TaxID=1904254 RepID=UPI0025B7EA12|nr:PPC domain-containing DNA-binding protein [Hydrogenophaga sp.]MBU4184304.1 DNA-binding protein [Gammaproteobacteria bacterium]MBU4282947.1 DNA-binding protein [Gammaproteobacteria bacterium]MBU4325586.1 DNA-binding protein [Gammaproteobacteria bacterium]MBU4508147.1 DNA-binding protein [Gammaproteobacteria bacterium]MCG2653863.1 DNA-binding protein [Hydrogenophaga sp.]